MDLLKAWRLSKIPYVELVYRSTQLVGGSQQAEPADARKRVESMLRGAKLNKAMYALFGCLGAAVPFAVSLSPVSLFSSISLSLLVGFAYILLFSLLTLPSFSSADAYSLLLSLPFENREFSLITLLSFLRTFDYLAAVTILVPSAAVALLTGSLAASVLMLCASAVNVVLAVFAGLWLSRVFYRNITRGGRSRGASILRMVFIMAWGFAVLSVGFAFQIVTNFLPFLHQLVAAGLSDTLGLALLALHPFAFGLDISSLAYPASFTSGVGGTGNISPIVLGYLSASAYAILAALAAAWSARTLLDVSHGQAFTVAKERASDFALKIRRPLAAFMLKDMRTASKNPSTGYIFILPVFGVLVFFMAISKGGIVNTYDVLVLTLIASSFTLMGSPLLLNAETKGQYYALSLPIGLGTIIESKVLVSTLTFLPVPFLLAAIQLLGSHTLGPVSFVPFLEVLSVGAAATAETATLMGGRRADTGEGYSNPGRAHGLTASAPQRASGFSVISGSNTGRTIESVIVGILVVLAPLASYLTTFSLGLSGMLSILAMLTIVALETMLAAFVLGLTDR